MPERGPVDLCSIAGTAVFAENVPGASEWAARGSHPARGRGSSPGHAAQGASQRLKTVDKLQGEIVLLFSAVRRHPDPFASVQHFVNTAVSLLKGRPQPCQLTC